MQALHIFFSLLLYLQFVNGIDIELHKRHKDECVRDQNKLAVAQSQFVECTIRNSVPVGICSNCTTNYNTMVIAYYNITKNEKCTKEFFDKDRINLMSTMQGMLKGLWTKAYCDDCFSGNNSEIFNEKWDDWNNCANKKPNNTVCITCELEYVDLNTFYKGLDVNNKGKVCYDLQDKMNRTRAAWSNLYKCCKREKNLKFFLLATGILAFLPFIFYGGAYIITKHQERNHGLLNEHEPGLNGPSISTLIAAAVIATPTTPPPMAALSASSSRPSHTTSAAAAPPVKSKYVPLENGDSDSDDQAYAAILAAKSKPLND